MDHDGKGDKERGVIASERDKCGHATSQKSDLKGHMSAVHKMVRKMKYWQLLLWQLGRDAGRQGEDLAWREIERQREQNGCTLMP